jgi:transcriptional regulator of aroF, aroG, tyrA and aromatic amino acid transport
MQLRLITEDRLGITHEVLQLIAARQLDLATMEMGLHNIYLNVPDLRPEERAEVEAALLAVPGVKRVEAAQLMPGEARRLQLDVLLETLPQPVLVIGSDGRVAMASAAARRAEGAGEAGCIGRSIDDVLGREGLWRELMESGARTGEHEVTYAGSAWVLDASPLIDPGTRRLTGAVLTLQDASWLGEQVARLQRKRPPEGFEALLGDSQSMRQLRARAQRVAVVDAPLMILGETGTGKELVARACHEASARRSAPFLALNAAALPESLAESELFGYAPGAFSGAQRGGKPGLLEMAGSGTVFLDEIGEMSPYLQTKLLRFLNDGTFRRIGGDRELRADVRILSATHRDLESMVERAEFREDLYYRLNVLNLHVAPLRERGDDILMLAEHFLARASQQVRRRVPRLTPAARQALREAPWPGNVRQLQNVIFRAVTLTESQSLDVADLGLHSERRRSAVAPPDEMVAQTWADAMAGFERDLLVRLYHQYPSSRKLAVRLGLSHAAVAKRLRRYGISTVARGRGAVVDTATALAEPSASPGASRRHRAASKNG